MGRNLMSGRRRHELIELATRTVAEQLRAPAVAKLLADLPPGAPERVGRPPGPSSEWPSLVVAAAPPGTGSSGPSAAAPGSASASAGAALSKPAGARTRLSR